MSRSDAAPTVREAGTPELAEPPELSRGGDGTVPWVETRAGGLFFINAVLVSPVFMALYPWTLRWLLRVSGILDRPSRVLDPVPAVADHFIPVLGWVTIPAAILVWKNLRIMDRPWARKALWVFLMAHLGTLAYTVLRVFG